GGSERGRISLAPGHRARSHTRCGWDEARAKCLTSRLTPQPHNGRASMTCRFALPLLLLGLGAATPRGPCCACRLQPAKRQDTEDEVIDQLIEVVKDGEENEAERAKACLALGKRGPKAKRAVPEMIALLKSTGEEHLRRPLGPEEVAMIAEGLGGIGPDAK